jgi:hypothetical protein
VARVSPHWSEEPLPTLAIYPGRSAQTALVYSNRNQPALIQSSDANMTNASASPQVRCFQPDTRRLDPDDDGEQRCCLGARRSPAGRGKLAPWPAGSPQGAFSAHPSQRGGPLTHLRRARSIPARVIVRNVPMENSPPGSQQGAFLCGPRARLRPSGQGRNWSAT